MTNQRAPGAGRSFARELADYLEIPPALAEQAGEPAMAAMTEIKHGVDAGGGDLRQVHLCRAQNQMARLDPYHHGPLLQHLQALVLSLGGRRGDTRIAHVTPGEMVVNDDLMTPEVVDLLRRTAKEKGLDYERFVVGSRLNSINPHTGQMEFFDEDDGSNWSSGESSNWPNSDYQLAADKLGTDWTRKGPDNVKPLTPPQWQNPPPPLPPISNAPDETFGVNGGNNKAVPKRDWSGSGEDPMWDQFGPFIPDAGSLPPNALYPSANNHPLIPIPPPEDLSALKPQYWGIPRPEDYKDFGPQDWRFVRPEDLTSPNLPIFQNKKTIWNV